MTSGANAVETDAVETDVGVGIERAVARGVAGSSAFEKTLSSAPDERAPMRADERR